MRKRSGASRLLAICWLLGWVVGCSSASENELTSSLIDPDAPQAGETGSAQMAGSGAASGASGSSGTAGTAGAGGSLNSNPMSSGPLDAIDEDCAADVSFKGEGCPCRAGETAACWTGPAADRNVRECHDGLQICESHGEFSTWGPCMGEQLVCGAQDAGVPPDEDPPPRTDCACIPGAVVQCSEDCTAFIICSLTATKTCLPDRTWSPCREDLNVPVDLPGFQCRNMFHGCLAAPEDADFAGQAEVYVGDCSKQFECGMAPSFL
jgi:hypothetical protein